MIVCGVEWLCRHFVTDQIMDASADKIFTKAGVVAAPAFST